MDRIECNGWTNYATWKVNLEIIGGMPLEEVVGVTIGFSADADKYLDKYDLSLYLKDWVTDYLECDVDLNTFAGSCVRYFLDDVDWVQIADHLIEEYKLEQEHQS